MSVDFTRPQYNSNAFPRFLLDRASRRHRHSVKLSFCWQPTNKPENKWKCVAAGALLPVHSIAAANNPCLQGIDTGNNHSGGRENRIDNRSLMLPLTPSSREAGQRRRLLSCSTCSAHLRPGATLAMFTRRLWFLFFPSHCRAGNPQPRKCTAAGKTELIAAVLDYKPAFNILN